MVTCTSNAKYIHKNNELPVKWSIIVSYIDFILASPREAKKAIASNWQYENEQQIEQRRSIDVSLASPCEGKMIIQ